MTGKTFSVVDYIVFVIFLCLSAAMGLYYACTGGKQKTLTEFLFGNRQLKVLPVVLSFVASTSSSSGILLTTIETYKYGGEASLYWVMEAVGPLATAFLFLPVMYDLKITSTYQYLELRFNKTIRRLAAIFYLVHTMMRMSMWLYLPCSALSQVSGLPLEVSLLLTGIICCFYTTIGGLKAVVSIDAIQQLLVVTGLLTVVIKGFLSLGGFAHVWQMSEEDGRTKIFNFDRDLTYMYSSWALLFGVMFSETGDFVCDQYMVQRYICIPSLKKAQRALLLAIPAAMCSKILYVLTGMVLYGIYGRCDPITTKRISKSYQLLPLFVMEYLGTLPGLPGLFVACVYGSALSSLSSGLNGVTTVTLEDIVSPISKAIRGKNLSEKTGAVISKIVVMIFGIFAIGLALAYPTFKGSFYQVSKSLQTIILGPLLALYTAGVFLPFVTSSGAVIGGLTGTSLICWVLLGSFYYEGPVQPPVTSNTKACNFSIFSNISLFSNYSTITDVGQTQNVEGIFRLYQLSSYCYTMVGFLVTIVAATGYNAILCYWKQNEPVDCKYLHPKIHHISCYKSMIDHPLEIPSRKNLLHSESTV